MGRMIHRNRHVGSCKSMRVRELPALFDMCFGIACLSCIHRQPFACSREHMFNMQSHVPWIFFFAIAVSSQAVRTNAFSSIMSEGSAVVVAIEAKASPKAVAKASSKLAPKAKAPPKPKGAPKGKAKAKTKAKGFFSFRRFLDSVLAYAGQRFDRDWALRRGLGWPRTPCNTLR